MLGLFRAVPQPEGLQALFSTFERLGVAQHPIGKQSREVFSGGSASQVHACRKVRLFFYSADGALLHCVGEAETIQVPVKQGVNAPVGGLLPHKSLYFSCKLRPLFFRQCLETRTHRIHKELLSDRKTHRQGIEKSRAKRVAAVPPGGKWGVEVHQQFANHQISHSQSTFIKFSPCTAFNTQVYVFFGSIASL